MRRGTLPAVDRSRLAAVLTFLVAVIVAACKGGGSSGY
jgi:hypothetical protein